MSYAVDLVLRSQDAAEYDMRELAERVRWLIRALDKSIEVQINHVYWEDTDDH